MSETEQAAEHDSLDEQTIPTEDWLLQDLVRIANESGDFELPITLVVGGGIVTGKLIDLKQYFREFGRLWNRSGTDEGAQLEEYFRKFGEDPAPRAEDAPPVLYNFIHLKDAHFGGGLGLMPTNMGFLWRGRLSQVSGFSLGAMMPGKTTVTATVDHRRAG